MLIALLVVLGVELIVIVVFAASVLGRRRWLRRQPGEFAGLVRVLDGEIDGLRSDWKRGSGRWVRDVLVWSKGPFLFRDVLVPVDRISGQRPARPGEVKRIGDNPIVIAFASGDATFEVASRGEQQALAAGTFTAPSEADPSTTAPV